MSMKLETHLRFSLSFFQRSEAFLEAEFQLVRILNHVTLYSSHIKLKSVSGYATKYCTPKISLAQWRLQSK